MYILFIIAIVFLLIIPLLHKKKGKVSKNIEDIINSSPYRKSEPVPKPLNDFLLRNQKQEVKKQEEVSSGVVKYDPKGLEKAESKIESKIVGVAEPKGFWSKFVISQKLGFIMARMSAQQSSENGFWVNLIKAQSMSQGKDQSRGR